MKFPKILKISLVSKDGKQIMLSDVVFSITLFAPKKNNYHLGPFFSTNSGTLELDEERLTISAEAVLDSGIMDYCHYSDCSDKVMIEILDSEQLNNLIKGTNLWGLLKDEEILYGSKEILLKRIKNNKNDLVGPKKIDSIFSGQEILNEKIVI
jgi:hypothetical protein